MGRRWWGGSRHREVGAEGMDNSRGGPLGGARCGVVGEMQVEEAGT